MSAKAGVDLAAWGQGVCAGDADGDGRIDLYVTNWGANVLFRNKGDGTFEDVAAQAGVAAGGWSTGCAFFDADADGDLDLYVARYVKTTWEEVVGAQRTLTWRNGPKIMVGPQGLPGEPDVFFENLGNGRFRDATAAAGLTDAAAAYGFGVVATDYDGDGRVDLFVANDSNPNFLYRNTTPAGRRAAVRERRPDRRRRGQRRGAGPGRDGRRRRRLRRRRPRRLRADGVRARSQHDLPQRRRRQLRGRERRRPALATSTFTRMGWGTAFLDADLDGRLDLVVANGHIFPDVDRFPALAETYAQASQLLLNQGGTFRDVSAGTGRGLQTPRVSRGLAVGDLDDDGDPDVVLSNMDAPPALLENRQRTGRHWIAFRLERAGGQPPRDRRDRDDHGRRQDADARGALRRQLSLAVGSAAAVRARRRGRSGVGRGADARRRPLVVAGSAGGPPAHARADGDRPPMTCRAHAGSSPSRDCSRSSVGVAAQTPSGAVYRPALKPPEFLEPFAPKVEPGHDAFIAEPIATAIEAQLRARSATR